MSGEAIDGVMKVVIVAVLSTTGLLAVVGATVYAVVRLYRFAKKLSDTLSQITADLVMLVRSIVEVSEVVDKVREELVFMRQISTGVISPGGTALDDLMSKSRENNAQGAAARGPIQFPSPNMDRYVRIQVEDPKTPDATVEDTDRRLLEQTDADLVEQEYREELRERGVVLMDDDETPPGVVAESR